jgi:hypothetical protein
VNKQNTGSATRFLWMILAPFEFIAMILIGVPLYLGLAAVIFLSALRGLFERAVALAVHRFRTGPILSSANESTTAPPPPLSEAPARGPVGRGRFYSWPN